MHVEIPEKPDVERLENIQLLKKPKKEKKKDIQPQRFVCTD